MPRLAVLAALALATGAPTLALGWLALGYRRTLVRALRERHPEVWEELGRPTPASLPWQAGARRLARFLRAGRHYALNDADLAAAGRLFRVTGWASVATAAVGTLLAWWGWG